MSNDRTGNAVRLTNYVAKALTLMADSDLTLMEQAAVFKLAAEACAMANAVHEVANAIHTSVNKRTGDASKS